MVLDMRPIFICMTAGLALSGVSCGKNPLYPVSGKVLYQGAPATGAAVFFYRPKAQALDEHLIMGIVQDDGTFELVCGSVGKGAPAGEYAVLIEWKQDAGAGKRRADRLQGRYADPKQPRWHALVEEKANHLSPFELEAHPSGEPGV
jgi:hypothetical protein